MAGAPRALWVGPLLIAAAVVFASPALLVPGVAVTSAAVALTTWARLTAWGASVARRGLPARVSEGEPFEVVLAGRSGALPLVGELEDPAVQAPVRVRRMRPRTPFELRCRGSMPRRGRHVLAPPGIRVGDRLGVASRLLGGGAESSILVLPRIEPVRGASDPENGPALGRSRHGIGDLAAGGLSESAADPEVDGLRPYRAGSPASRIYWPALARGGELVERHLAPTAESGPLVVLDPSSAADPGSLDRSVRAAASLAAHLARLGGCELVIGGARRRYAIGADRGSLESARAALALVAGDDGLPRPPALAPGTTLIWVSAGGSPPAGLGGPRSFLVRPEPLAGTPALFSVAGCSGYPLVGARPLPTPRGIAA